MGRRVTESGQSDIAPMLLPWFERHGRKDLPWQNHDDNTGYRVWLSEIMLQQTQVATVIPYFNRFVDSFPDLIALADAGLDEVLQHWAGLGYYARARNLHKTACRVRDEHGGVFPANLQQLIELPGIGRSTAGAILSLAFGQSAAILDGNVKRILSRVYRVDGWYSQSRVQKHLWELADSNTPQSATARYNQAMMDLGATVCKRSKPLCHLCPLAGLCQARACGEQALFPRAKPRRKRPLRHRWLLIHRYRDEVLLEQRPAQGIWGGLWSLPELEQDDMLASWQLSCLGAEQAAGRRTEHCLRHQFTHFELDISLIEVEVGHEFRQFSTQHIADTERRRWVAWSDLGKYGLPAPVARLLDDISERE